MNSMYLCTVTVTFEKLMKHLLAYILDYFKFTNLVMNTNNK